MADGVTDPPIAAETKPEQTTTRPADADTTMTDVGAEVKPADEGSEPSKTDEAPQGESGSSIDANGTAEPPKPDEKTSSTDTTNADNAVAQNGTAEPKKRKSVGGAPDHKGKRLGRKKSMPQININNCQPGEYYWAKTKGNPRWPCIICDEDMLPDTLLAKRPVSAARADGTIRDDFAEGGKNAKDRRYPIMFLGTNEFAWQVNSDLQPLETSEVKELLAKGQTAKMTKKLWEAYEVCVEEHELDYFKTMLNSHYEAAREEERKIAEEEEARQKEAEAAKAEVKTPKAKKEKGKRKSKAAVDDDLEMPDVDTDVDEKNTKSSNKKKRKASEAAGEEKPPKTQKLKLNVKEPKELQEGSAKKTPKPRAKKAAKASEEEEPSVVEEKPAISEEEQILRTRKTVLYLRHRLQKGFLSRDSEPKEEEMADMANHFNSLEEYKELDADIIKGTKIHKVLKAIIKLPSIPKDEKFKFKERSQDLLGHWNKALAADTGAQKSNGVSHEEDGSGSKSPDKKEDAKGEGETEGEAEAPATAAVSEEPAKTEEPAKAEETGKVEEPATIEASAEVSAKQDAVAEETGSVDPPKEPATEAVEAAA